MSAYLAQWKPWVSVRRVRGGIHSVCCSSVLQLADSHGKEVDGNALLHHKLELAVHKSVTKAWSRATSQ